MSGRSTLVMYRDVLAKHRVGCPLCAVAMACPKGDRLLELEQIAELERMKAARSCRSRPWRRFGFLR